MAKIDAIDVPKLTFPEAAAPSTPAASKVVIYAKSDGLMYSKDDAGVETVMSGGGGGGGSTVWLQRQTASTSATLDCTTFISATYETYMFIFISIVPVTDNTNFLMRMGTGGGPTYDTGANYGWAAFRHSPSGSAVAGASSGQTSIGLDGSGGIDNATSSALNGTLYLYNPGSAIHKRITADFGYTDNAGALIGTDVTATYQSTTAVTAVRFLMASGSITSGTIDVYGITKA